jgi:hypothetical protein
VASLQMVYLLSVNCYSRNESPKRKVLTLGMECACFLEQRKVCGRSMARLVSRPVSQVLLTIN